LPLFSRLARPEQPCVLQLPVSVISPNPNQPRRTFSRSSLQEMALSIRELGVLQPLTVRQGEHGWELIAGERRLRAAVMAGLERVPCIAVEADDSRSTLMALVENVQRQDLDFWEEALALERLMEVCSLSQSEAARKVGLSPSAVANKLRLLKLPAEVLRTLRDGGCTERHARALLPLSDRELQRAAAERVAARSLTVAQTEALVASILSPVPQKRKPICRIKDVRLFLNTIDKGLSLMKSAGIAAQCGREESEEEITLTIRIPKHST